MTSGPKVHTFDEVAKHDNNEDCWLIISGKVYDLSSYLDDHPGGDIVLVQATGKDATKEFEEVGHSDDAMELMLKYYIGEIDSSTIPAEAFKKKAKPTPIEGAGEGYSRAKQISENIKKILLFLMPLLILVLAFAFRQYIKEK